MVHMHFHIRLARKSGSSYFVRNRYLLFNLNPFNHLDNLKYIFHFNAITTLIFKKCHKDRVNANFSDSKITISALGQSTKNLSNSKFDIYSFQSGHFSKTFIFCTQNRFGFNFQTTLLGIFLISTLDDTNDVHLIRWQ